MLGHRALSGTQLIILLSLAAICTITIFASLSFGGFKLTLTEVLFGDLTKVQERIFFEIRMPRILLAIIVGASLGFSGAALQGLFRNPLADPGLIGVSAGAALGAVVGIVLFSNSSLAGLLGIYFLPVFAMTGALFVILLLLSLSQGSGAADLTYLLLLGIAINSLATVGIGFLTFVSDDSQLRGLTFWMMGSFGAATSEAIWWVFFLACISGGVIIGFSRQLDILQLGPAEASRIGVDNRKINLLVVVLTALIIGAGVAFAGIIGFIGLIVPHIVRLLGGAQHLYVLSGSSLLGAVLALFADTVARVALLPAEIPVGLVTSAIGAPIFLAIVIKVRKR